MSTGSPVSHRVSRALMALLLLAVLLAVVAALLAAHAGTWLLDTANHIIDGVRAAWNTSPAGEPR